MNNENDSPFWHKPILWVVETMDGKNGFWRCALLFVSIMAVATGLVYLVAVYINNVAAVICGSMALTLGYAWKCHHKKRQ